jgi:hypothetical protein
MTRWVIQGQLARGQRPGYSGERGISVSVSDVDVWIKEAREIGIRSIICLLAHDQLCLYTAVPGGLISYYRQAGFQVEHVCASDRQSPPLSSEHLAKVWDAFEKLPPPILIHCSVGIDRTGLAVEHIRQRLAESNQSGEV